MNQRAARPLTTRSGFDCYVRQIGDALDALGVESAIVCGISYGGLIAATFAARHPERTRAVVVVSAIPPSWKPDARVRFLMRAPTLLSPLFCVNSLRLFPEMVAAKENVRSAISFALRHLATVVRNRFSPRLMARRVRLLEENSSGGRTGSGARAHARRYGTGRARSRRAGGLDSRLPAPVAQCSIRIHRAKRTSWLHHQA